MTKRVRTRSIPNVETDRLLGRLNHVRSVLLETLQSCEQKNDVRAHAREVVNIERELTRRAVTFEPVSNGHHLTVDVFAHREIRPLSHAERDVLLGREPRKRLNR